MGMVAFEKVEAREALKGGIVVCLFCLKCLFECVCDDDSEKLET